jgi:hypothetical protein
VLLNYRTWTSTMSTGETPNARLLYDVVFDLNDFDVTTSVHPW